MTKVQYTRVQPMDSLAEFSRLAYYEFRVLGRLSQQGSPWFEGMDITGHETVIPIQTIIQGSIVDQAALHGLISRVRDLGLTLLSVNRIERKEEDGDKDILSEG
jgi:hypothetical protein